MKIASHLLCLLLLTVGSATPLRAQSDKADSTEKSIDQILEVCQIIADNHVEPPVMQQLMLDAAKAIYKAGNRSAPRELSNQLSLLNSKDDFRATLRSAFTQSAANDGKAVLEELLLRIPGTGRLISASEANVSSQLTANQFVGVGIAFSIQDDRPRITTLFYGGPAHNAGVKTHDIILMIDDRDTQGKSPKEIVNELRGEAGSKVVLVVRHATAGQRKVEITRNKTFIPTVHGASQDSEGKWQYRFTDQPDFAMLKIDAFGAGTANELRRLDAKHRDTPVKGIVLDLRGGGGSLKHVVMVADQFLDEGTVGSTTIGDRKETYQTKDGVLFEGVPMVILTARASSASSVFLAAALQDRERGVVVGHQTNGMSYVRSQYELSNGDKVIIPSGFACRINGTKLFVKPHPLEMFRRPGSKSSPAVSNRKSANLIEPDHRVEDDSDEMAVVTRAIEVLREMNVPVR